MNALAERVGGMVLVDTGPRSAYRWASLRSRRLARSAKNWWRTRSPPPRTIIVHNAFSEALAHWNVEPALPRLNVPTLIIWGEKDNVVPPQVARRYLELLPQARLIIIPGAGHTPQLQRPDELSRALNRSAGE